MSTNAIAAAYDLGAVAYAEAWSEPHPWLHSARISCEQQFKPGFRLLDGGCGPGHDSAYWSKRGLITRGVDISASMIDIARCNYPALDFAVADFRDELA